MVFEFLDMLSDELRPRAEADFKVMAEMKKAEGASSVSISWELGKRIFISFSLIALFFMAI